MISLSALLASYRRAGNWLLPVLRERRELARLPVARIGQCDVHFALGGGEYLAYFGISPRRETLRQRALRLMVGLAAGPFGAVLTLQPDATAGIDTRIRSSFSTFNYGISDTLINSTTDRGLLRFNVSVINSAAVCNTASVSCFQGGSAAS